MRPLSIFDDRQYKKSRPSRARRILSWLEEAPGGISTMIVLACFLAGAWAAWALWSMVCCRP